MEIHIPKPWHGVREFLKEYAIIVVGVLTALAGEQLVENIHHQHQLQIAEKALKVDFARFVRFSAEHAAATSCVEARLAELRAIIEDGSRDSKLGEIGPIPALPGHSWEIASWDTIVGSQAATYVPQEQMNRYSRAAKGARDAEISMFSEAQTWAVLKNLSGPARRFTDAEQSKLRSDIALAGQLWSQASVMARATESTMTEAGLLTPEEIATERANGERSDIIKSICTSIAYKPAGDQPRFADKAQPAK